jgi:hypothetical protein
VSDHRDPFAPADAAGLPAWVAQALRAPVATDPAGKRRLMRRVRAAGAPDRAGVPRRAGWPSRHGLAPLAGLAAAAAFAGVTVLGAGRAALAPVAPSVAGALRDTLLVAVRPALGDRLGDTLGHALLRDTLRLVRFALVAPAASRLALVGDFNGWDPTATPMLAVAGSTDVAPRVWTATVPLRVGTHRYAFLVDDTRWVADPAAARAADSAGRARSTLVVPAARD